MVLYPPSSDSEEEDDRQDSPQDHVPPTHEPYLRHISQLRGDLVVLEGTLNATTFRYENEIDDLQHQLQRERAAADGARRESRALEEQLAEARREVEEVIEARNRQRTVANWNEETLRNQFYRAKRGYDETKFDHIKKICKLRSRLRRQDDELLRMRRDVQTVRELAKPRETRIRDLSARIRAMQGRIRNAEYQARYRPKRSPTAPGRSPSVRIKPELQSPGGPSGRFAVSPSLGDRVKPELQFPLAPLYHASPAIGVLHNVKSEPQSPTQPSFRSLMSPPSPHAEVEPKRESSAEPLRRFTASPPVSLLAALPTTSTSQLEASAPRIPASSSTSNLLVLPEWDVESGSESGAESGWSDDTDHSSQRSSVGTEVREEAAREEEWRNTWHNDREEDEDEFVNGLIVVHGARHWDNFRSSDEGSEDSMDWDSEEEGMSGTEGPSEGEQW